MEDNGEWRPLCRPDRAGWARVEVELAFVAADASEPFKPGLHEPAMSANKAFNPLDKRNLADSVVRALLTSPCQRLPPKQVFDGAGIYVIYYAGGYEHYAWLAKKNKRDFTIPIYVGKARNKGARKGLADDATGQPLYNRLAEHSESIEATANLDIDDFQCRYLVVDDIWVPLAEQLLIRRYQPLWNVVVDGFGNHDPGSGRYKQRRSAWDIIHEGRDWAAKLSAGKVSAKQLQALVEAHLRELK